MKTQTKDKIINDPIYGFISLDDSLILKLIDHPYFQRLRKISQLGLSYLVYPGATHSRFNHALGCMHLMKKVIYQLKNKGQIISKIESRALKVAILLHDIGHGPFSHALENSIVTEISHENLSLCFMKAINEDFNGELQTAIDIFNNKYKKRFLHQLVSSQLDMDRLDYLKRDSFFSKSEIEGLDDGFYVVIEYEVNYTKTRNHIEYLLLRQNDKLKWKIIDFQYQFQQLE